MLKILLLNDSLSFVKFTAFSYVPNFPKPLEVW